MLKKLTYYFFYTCAIVVLLFFCNATAHADTSLTGNISGILTAENSPYIVEGDLQVPENEMLTIEKGVQIIFCGFYVLDVKGKITANGTKDDPIIFTAANSEEGWHGIKLQTTNNVDTNVLRHCIVEYGKQPLLEHGGGILTNCKYVIIDHCLIQYNRATHGGGIQLNCKPEGMAVVSNCIIKKNYAYDDGGGLASAPSYNLTIENCLVAGNEAGDAGGAIAGGGMRLHGYGAPRIINCTVTDNNSITGDSGVSLYWNLEPVLYNCIIYGNNGQDLTATVPVMPTYCNIGSGFIPGEGNISEAVNFVDPLNEDYHLLPNSPCIDAGTNIDIPSIDLDDNPRPQNDFADMGAYESGSFFATLQNYNAVCATACDGEIYATAYGGEPPYSFLWSNGATTPYIQNLCPDYYQVTITDANGNTFTQAYQIRYILPSPQATIGVNSIEQPLQNNLFEFYAVINEVFCANTNINWNFGDGTGSNALNPTHSYTSAGTYTVTFTYGADNGCEATQTLTLNVLGAFQQNIDTTLCQGQSLLLPNNEIVTQAGTYTIEMGNDTTLVYNVLYINNFEVIGDTTSVATCEPAFEINISTQGENSPLTYNWSNGATTQNINVWETNTYTVTVSNTCFEHVFSKKIVFGTDFNLNIGNNMVLCEGEEVVLQNSFNEPSVSYQWNTGSTEPFIVVSEAGTYWVNATNLCGSKTDSVTVGVLPTNWNVSAGNDMLLCAGETATFTAELNANIQNLMYEWNTGATTTTIQATQQGEYIVKVKNDCITRTDTVFLQVQTAPMVLLPEKQTLCVENNQNVINAFVPNATDYEWNTGENTPEITILNSDIYTVTVSNQCGESTAQICVDVKSCEPACETLQALHYENCDANTQTYTVYFMISGGNAPYTVTGDYTGTVNTENTVINFGNFAQGQPYAFDITDANGCVLGILEKPTCNPLPIELLRFEALEQPTYNQLQWTVASETNCHYYTLQASPNGAYFQNIATLQGKGTTAQTQQYTYLHHNFSPLTYYQLLQTDFDGTTYTVATYALQRKKNTIALEIKNVLPMPVQNTTKVDFYCPQSQKVTLQIIDIQGKKIIQQNLYANEGNNQCTLNTQAMEAGVYVLVLKTENNIVMKKIVK